MKDFSLADSVSLQKNSDFSFLKEWLLTRAAILHLYKLCVVLYCCFYPLWLNADISLCHGGGAML